MCIRDSYKAYYYESLRQSSDGWESNENSYFPFVENFLSMLYMCYNCLLYTSPVRFYEKDSEEKGRPCLVFLHGGAFIGGSAETVEEPCRLLAELSGALVISVEYSLAPEAAFPRAIEECCAVLEEVWKDPEVIFDRGRLFLGGEDVYKRQKQWGSNP